MTVRELQDILSELPEDADVCIISGEMDGSSYLEIYRAEHSKKFYDKNECLKLYTYPDF